MLLRASIALLLLSACATVEPSPRGLAAAVPDRRIANLRRAATLPWTDDGQCVVREASNTWPVLAERCFHALDHDRVRFQDLTGRCAVAVAPAIAVGVGVCILAAAEMAAGAVLVVGGAVIVVSAIQAELDTYERGASREPPKPKPLTKPTTEPVANPEPDPKGSPSGGDWFPPKPPGTQEPPDRRPECLPRQVPPKGGSEFHNTCADNVPFNAFRGHNVLVNGKAFDALQPSTRTLWEVKTGAIEKYNSFVRRMDLEKQVTEARRERLLANACGFDFRIGVRSAALKDELERAAPDLEGIIVIMDWC